MSDNFKEEEYQRRFIDIVEAIRIGEATLTEYPELASITKRITTGRRNYQSSGGIYPTLEGIVSAMETFKQLESNNTPARASSARQ
ncbi:hypothetical protein AYI68_g8272 [Smittium mucronatum]|uniref:Uncharacterized protein n=1 Tax=Smittium mucronatum TaxID=133383 RepID=A0A1R0GLD0_9FUNG|nr:hypothetical protein AYI68_g8272 [Smittium mucronatum]